MLLTKIIFLILSLHGVFGGNFLFISVDPATSHINSFIPVIEGLLSRGHKVTTIIRDELKISNENYTEVFVKRLGDLSDRIKKLDIINTWSRSCYYGERSLSCFNIFLNHMLGVLGHGRHTCKVAFLSENVQNFIRTMHRQKFDAVIAELFVEEIMYLFAYILEVPLILISSFDYDAPNFVGNGLHSIWSNFPQLEGSYDRHLSFTERFFNRVFTFWMTRFRKYFHIKESDKLAAEFFRKYGQMPSVLDFERTASLLIFNSLEVLQRSKLRNHGFVNIAGIHIKEVKPLDQKYQEFLDGATNGAVYFSLGSIITSAVLPSSTIYAIVRAFQKLNLRVIWKYEGDEIDFPQNVLAEKWVPQNDILAHKNVKVFITHGGNAGLQEGLYHKKPMIVIPVFGDQYVNAFKIVDAGIGRYLNVHEISTERIMSEIKEVMKNRTHNENVEMLSEAFRNGSVNPLDNVLFWIEHVLKFKSAKYFTPPTPYVGWYEYLYLDFLCIFYAFYKIILFFVRKCCWICLRKRKPEVIDTNLLKKKRR